MSKIALAATALLTYQLSHHYDSLVRVTLAVALALFSSATPPPVPGFPIDRCVRVLGVTAPEDAKTAGFEYLELTLQDLPPLPDGEFDRTVTRLRAIGIPLLSGYGFMPANVSIVGQAVDTVAIDRHLRHGLSRAAKLGLAMVVYGNLNTVSRRAPEGFAEGDAWKQMVDFGRRAAHAAAIASPQRGK